MMVCTVSVSCSCCWHGREKPLLPVSTLAALAAEGLGCMHFCRCATDLDVQPGSLAAEICLLFRSCCPWHVWLQLLCVDASIGLSPFMLKSSSALQVCSGASAD